MTRTAALASILGCLAFVVSGCGTGAPDVTSTLIVNARIYDGNGGETFAGAVRIDADRIVAVGELESLEGEHVIDAGGLSLAPGFIDTHSHHDEEPEKFRHMPGVLSQGVTTIVRGMDGSSGNSGSVTEFNETFEAAPAAVNIASFAAHNSIRQAVMGDDNRRHATDEEIQKMSAFVEADMQAGALGLSTGLEYEPGIFSATEEVIALAVVAASYGGRYSSHLRDEDDLVMEAIDEHLRIGREARIPVQISHIKLADRALWGTTDLVLGRLDEARAAGIDVTADIYPYLRWASSLAILFPERDYTRREDAKFTFAHTAAPEDILLLRFPPNPAFEGKTIDEIARVTERPIEDTLMDLAQEADNYLNETGQAGSFIIAKGMQQDDVAAFMRWPYLNICSDGWHGGHPRGYGSFPRVLGYFVRELGVLSLPDAIRKMTGLAADNMGIIDRGRIAVGHYADLVLFNPETVADHATMKNPTDVSTGIEQVWVNGLLAFDNGEPTAVYNGQIVRRAQ